MLKGNTQNEIDIIISKLITNPNPSTIQSLCIFMTKNKSSCEESIKKLSEFFSTNYTIPVDLLKKIIIPVLKLLKETSQLISFINFIMPNLVKPIFFSNRSIDDVNQITKTIGLIIEKGEAYTWQLMETSIYDIFYYFSNEKNFRYPNIKYAMLLLLTEFIENAPMISHSKIIEERLFYLIQIIQNFRDESEDIRRAVGLLIERCVRLIISKGSGRINSILDMFQIISPIMQSSYDNSKEKDVNGILTAVKALSVSQEFFRVKYMDIIKYMNYLKDNKIPEVRIELIDSIAFFAEALKEKGDQKQFDEYIELFLPYLMTLLESKGTKRLKGALYLSLGKLSRICCNETLETHISVIIKVIKEQIDSNMNFEQNEIFKCIADLMWNYREQVLLKIDYKILMEKIFINGFYQSQIDLLDQILLSESFNKINKSMIIKAVLNVISMIICQKKLKLLYYDIDDSLDEINRKKAKDFINKNRKAINSYISSKELNNDNLIANALYYLGKIQDECFYRDILSFYETYCLQFLRTTNDNQWCMQIRLKCIDLSKAEWTKLTNENDTTTTFFISSILDAYLNVVLNDSNDELKLAMISSIDDRYDSLLTKPPFFHKLISLISLRDTSIQKEVIKIIGRLADKNHQLNNPTALFIKKEIMNLLVLIKESNANMQKEEHVIVLYYYIKHAKQHLSSSIDIVFNTLQMIIQSEPDLNEIIMKTICEIIPLLNEGIDLSACLNICIENLKEGVNMSRLDISLRTIYEIIKKNKINLYQSSKSHLELVKFLLKIMTRDENKMTMQTAMKIFGYIGAMNPEQLERLFTKNKLDINETDQKKRNEFYIQNAQQQGSSTNPSNRNEVDQCTKQVVIFFMRILKENTNQELSNQIISNLSSLFKALQPTDSSLIDIILPTVLEVIPKLEETYAKGLLDSLLIILVNFRGKFQNFLGELLQLLMLFITKENYHDIVFKILHDILREFDIESYFSLCIPIFMNLLKVDSKGSFMKSSTCDKEGQTIIQQKNSSEISFQHKKINIIEEIFKCFSLMANKLSTYLNVILPHTIVLYQQMNNYESSKAILSFIGKVTILENFVIYLPSIIHALINKIQIEKTFAQETLEIFIYMNKVLHNDFIGYLPNIISTYRSLGLLPKNFASFSIMINERDKENYRKGCTCSKENDSAYGNNYPMNSRISNLNSSIMSNDLNASTVSFCTSSGLKNRKSQIKKDSVVNTFDVTHCIVENDWREWFKATSKILFEQSPSFALFCCHQVADYYSPLIIELYNYAFISGWRNLNDFDKMKISTNLNIALASETTPTDVLLTLLNLTEFMEREENVLDFIDFSKLGLVSMKCKAYAKALYYKECEYRNKTEMETLETLVSLYHELKLPESVSGILKQAEKNTQLIIDEDNWNVKLHRWKKGLYSANKRLINSPNNTELIKDKLICLNGLFDWEGILEMPAPALPNAGSASSNNKSEIIIDLFTKASLHLSKWDEFRKYSTMERGKKDEYENNFYSAINSILSNDYPKAVMEIEMARKDIEAKLKSLLSESYARGYELLFKNEVLFHLEEIIQLKQDKISHQNLMDTWNKRLSLIEKYPHNYERILAVRSIVIPMEEDYENYLNLAKICRKENRFDACYKVLNRIKSKLDPLNTKQEILVKIDLNINQCLFEEGKENEAIANAKKLIISDHLMAMSPKIKSKVYGSYAIYSLNHSNISTSSFTENSMQALFNYLTLSTKFNSKNYLSWHTYALQNYKFYDHIITISTHSSNMQYAINAIKGFMHSISIGGKNISKTLQDLLRLVDIWFRTGSSDAIAELITKCFEEIAMDSFLLIIPQLLARVNISNKVIFNCLHRLLSKMGNQHPHALIYPLIVLKKAKSEKRRIAAENILAEMIKDHSALISECELFVDEMNRCAMLIHEEWSEAIEEGAKLYLSSNENKKMITILLNVHKKMKREPQTMNEKHFYQLYSSELKEAESHLLFYIENGNQMDLNQAWDIYYSIFRNIGETFKDLQRLELRSVSPELDKFTDSHISVPGLYMKDDGRMINIARMGKTMTIFATKQHPRKVWIYGTDEKEYMFLLKGHEDLRQDERAMQLFNLINALLANERETANKNLFIECFSVIPLSHNTGIIGWVPNCDTLHQLIKEYRISNKCIAYSDYKFIINFMKHYETSTFLNKVEAFKSALLNTSGLEIYKILWIKSRNSEVWLERRTNYSHSLAVMSMVGYILGLGDRHPSNLMLDRKTGKIIHIDFGDCFEVAMKRDKFPERVPFRLTRMLIKALEVSGIEGTFRITCENVMRILRANKDSLLAILTSFVHDPLISFRLMIPMIMKRNRHKKKIENSEIGLRPIFKKDSLPLDTVTEMMREKEKNEPDENYERKHTLGTAEKQIMNLFEEKDEVESEELNQIAKIVLDRINAKLQGTDFLPEVSLSVKDQVNKLIIQATSHENLAQSYIGWCPYW